ncbi:hypothetical protein [Micromonospora coxensis]|uniref:Uncharacterized protein n=1 Tax=Micromonospora coxensis TaxID=356852 RepID=A0A1C5JPS6_9ACTN|nr:hypothetical protein [Micromonospora coxensis]SCG72483.1 hypothetical protein GA0070614_5006 [Micromonospora coxensis]
MASDSEQPRLWKVVVALSATERRKDEICDRIVDLICADPNHEGPCDTPWALHVVDGDSLGRGERRRLQAEIDDTMAG